LQSNQNADSLATRKQQFESEFAEWIASQNAWVDSHGVPGADLRPW
jgi:post-segregation antitoxin (ccd killing protein)